MNGRRPEIKRMLVRGKIVRGNNRKRKATLGRYLGITISFRYVCPPLFTGQYISFSVSGMSSSTVHNSQWFLYNSCVLYHTCKPMSPVVTSFSISKINRC